MLLPFLALCQEAGGIVALWESLTFVRFLLQGDKAVLLEKDCTR